MKAYFRHFFTVFILAALCTGCAKEQQDKKTDENALKAAMLEYQEAYNRQDVEKFASLWASDAVFENPLTGEKAEGREEIKELFAEKFSQEPQKHIEILPTKIEFSSQDEAVENGMMKIAIPDQPTKQIAFQVVYVKENGKWLIDEIRQIDMEPSSTNYEHLKDLSMLIGNWEDSDENVQISFEGDWDKYKNFLTQHFKLQIFGQDDLEGKQIIAWDPQEKKIRSWLFDSHGTFGEGTWTKIDKSWYAAMKYTLNDGGAASATNVYTPVDDQTYTFASIEREVDGEILPNMDPVNVERVK